MYFDLNVPIHFPQPVSTANKKNKGKQPYVPVDVVYSPGQIAAIETRVDVLVHLGYTVIAFNQTVASSVHPQTHANTLEPLLAKLKPRQGIVFLKRLTIVLDQESEKSMGLTLVNAHIFKPYDLIALMPTSQNTFSLACLTHTVASPVTAHIIAVPLTLRMDFRMRHTLVRGALKNGVVFEISYVGALGGEHDAIMVEAGAADKGVPAKRNWWTNGKEIIRITKGKGILVSGGVVAEADLRAPKDAANLITLLGVAQDVAQAASTKVPKALVLRAQTRQTYRAVLSDPILVVPSQEIDVDPPSLPPRDAAENKKRTRDSDDVGDGSLPIPGKNDIDGSLQKKKKRKKDKKASSLAVT
ncbi:PHP domain-like protein [Mycena indigotica]|uniref:PHP domain-like protein n=1 Tax=Mycena indigotica TaxID=2126181 RepID=A0A8H6SGX0_9AGAR|nr:PHP domain-like protein [Mycena indigotica]KAF7298748.1 PHP domain-like protein [Mycena indigotica]